MVVAIRGALDIGSGQHKLLIAAVDTVSRRIVRKIHLDQAGVLLGHSLVQSADGRLDEAILEDSRSVFERFAAAGREHGATEWAGVCTAVFRRASNGEEHLARANAELGLNLNLIEQKLEGELGYLAASSGCEASAEQLVAWDSGSGSFQVSSRAGDGALKVWEGPIGDSDVTAALVRDVQKRDFAGGGKVGQRASPNPVSLTQAGQLSALLLDARIPPPPGGWRRRARAAPCSSASARRSDLQSRGEAHRRRRVWRGGGVVGDRARRRPLRCRAEGGARPRQRGGPDHAEARAAARDAQPPRRASRCATSSRWAIARACSSATSCGREWMKA